MAYIEALQDAIKKLHGCDSTYVESIPVHEQFQGQTVWAGEVEVFDLHGHPKAKRCYAWAHKQGDKDEHTRYIAVLEIPPVDSPTTAVQASIVADKRGYMDEFIITNEPIDENNLRRLHGAHFGGVFRIVIYNKNKYVMGVPFELIEALEGQGEENDYEARFELVKERIRKIAAGYFRRFNPPSDKEVMLPNKVQILGDRS